MAVSVKLNSNGLYCMSYFLCMYNFPVAGFNIFILSNNISYLDYKILLNYLLTANVKAYYTMSIYFI